MNIEAFNKRDIQTFLALLNTAESEGISDIKVLRQRISDRLTDQSKAFKIAHPKARYNPHSLVVPKKCPHCGLMMGVYEVDRQVLYICTNRQKGDAHIGCQYSEVL